MSLVYSCMQFKVDVKINFIWSLCVCGEEYNNYIRSKLKRTWSASATFREWLKFIRSHHNIKVIFTFQNLSWMKKCVQKCSGDEAKQWAGIISDMASEGILCQSVSYLLKLQNQHRPVRSQHLWGCPVMCATCNKDKGKARCNICSCGTTMINRNQKQVLFSVDLSLMP